MLPQLTLSPATPSVNHRANWAGDATAVIARAGETGIILAGRVNVEPRSRSLKPSSV